MKRELQVHLIPLLGIFLFTSLIWSLNRVPFYHYLFLLFGLGIGAFLLDLDHFIFWFVINPNTPNSQLALTAFRQSDWHSLFKLLETTHRQHTNLVFHHFFFQITLTITSIFVFTISTSVFVLGLLLALNIHLLVDETDGYFNNKKHLQNWLFAREEKQLPIAYLGHYLISFAIIAVFLLTVMVMSKI